MREFLFRGKRLDNGEWVCGFYVHHRNAAHYILDIMHGGYEDINGEFFVPRWYLVDPTTVGQYTGLKDKNGKRIFEGDVFKERNGDAFVVKYGIFKPYYFYEAAGIRHTETNICGLYGEYIGNREQVLITDATYLFEVIGNIHDNPELLEVRNNA